MLQQFREENRDLMVNIGGTIVHRDDAGVSPFDSLVQNGDGVWEGLRVYDGKIFRLGEHLERLRRSAVALSYEGVPPAGEIVEEIRRTLAANRMRDNVHIRLTLSRGRKCTSGLDPRLNTSGTMLIVLAEHKPPVYDKSGIRLITARHRRPPDDVLDQKIHSCNQLTSILAKLEVRDIAPDEVYAAEEMFCTGTMGEIVAVVEVDGRAIGSGERGPLTDRLCELFAALTATEGVPVV